MEIYTGLGKAKSTRDKIVELLVYVGVLMGLAALLFMIKAVGLALGLV